MTKHFVHIIKTNNEEEFIAETIKYYSEGWEPIPGFNYNDNDYKYVLAVYLCQVKCYRAGDINPNLYKIGL